MAMWIRRFERMHRATVPRSEGRTVGHGRRRPGGLAPVLRSRITVSRVVVLLVVAAIALMVVGVDPIFFVALGLLGVAGLALLGPGENRAVRVALFLVAAATLMAVVSVLAQ